jgi:hypothetical protein
MTTAAYWPSSHIWGPRRCGGNRFDLRGKQVSPPAPFRKVTFGSPLEVTTHTAGVNPASLVTPGDFPFRLICPSPLGEGREGVLDQTSGLTPTWNSGRSRMTGRRDPATVETSVSQRGAGRYATHHVCAFPHSPARIRASGPRKRYPPRGRGRSRKLRLASNLAPRYQPSLRSNQITAACTVSALAIAVTKAAATPWVASSATAR